MTENEVKKLLADLDTVDFDDLGGKTFHGKTVDMAQWDLYQRIVKALADLPDKCKGVLSLDYLDKPNSTERDATITVKMSQAATMAGETKTALAAAVLICDRVFLSVIGDKVRISFMVDNIWMN